MYQCINKGFAITYLEDNYTGCPDQIGRNFKITLFHNQKTNRKCKDSFGIVMNMALKYVFSLYDLGLGISLDPLKWGLLQYGIFQMRQNKGIP